jgi:pimeloyl-ACP methyl ester carboxylesterase
VTGFCFYDIIYAIKEVQKKLKNNFWASYFFTGKGRSIYWAERKWEANFWLLSIYLIFFYNCMRTRVKVFAGIVVVAMVGVVAYFNFITPASALVMVDTTRYLTGTVIDSQTNQPVSNALVKLVYTNYFPTEEDCQQDYVSIAPPNDYYCVAGENPYLKLYTDENGNYSSGNFTQFVNMPESDYDFVINVSADGHTEQNADYLYNTAVDCDEDDGCDYKVVVNFGLTPVASARTPIVIVPGIMGSYLFDLATEEVWPNIPLMIADYWDIGLNHLILPEDGVPQGSEIMIPDRIFRSIYGQDYFEGLINELTNSGYEEGKDLFVFPYDWRLDINQIVDGENINPLIVSLKSKIEAIINQTGAEKVDIIAHSMGGLVAKRYIQKYGSDNVDKFIDIATPHLGAPKAFKILFYGDNLDIPILNTNRVRIISQNMPAVYQLLPSREYFNSTDQNYDSYIYDYNDLDQNGIKGELNYDESIEFMKNAGGNDYLLAKNDELHNEADNFNPNVYGIKAFNIVGCNQPTIGKVYILNKEKNGHEYGLKYISGDSTVPQRSAEGLNNAVRTYYATGAEHSAIPSHTGVKELVSAIENNQENNFDYSQYSNVSQNDSACVLNGWEVSYHSPIELHIYDENNNHLGPNQDGGIEMGIAGASYDIIDGNKFAFLPKGHTYRIVGQATDSGTFNARVQDIQNGETIETQYFNQVALNLTSTNIEYNLNDQTENVVMNVDEDGDRVFEQTIEPSSILDQTESQDAIKPQTVVTIDGTVGQNDWYTSTATIILTGQDEEAGSGVLKTEYSLDNGTTWQTYVEPIVLEADDVYNILYKSTDKAGNIETEKEITVKIDKTGPTIDIFSPLNNSEYLRSEITNLVYDVTDAGSGVATDTIKMFVDNTELSTSAMRLFDYLLGAHTVSVSARDLAGNFMSTTIDFNISADIDSTISDVNTLYASGAINDKANKQLANSLKLIKIQIERFGQKKIIVDNKFNEAVNKCVPKKGNKWCNSKLQPRISRVFFSLDKIRDRIIIMQYQLILAELKQFNKKSWINLQAYKILTEDINYLINELK